MRIQTPEQKNNPDNGSMSVDSSHLLFIPGQSSVDSPITESKEPTTDLKGHDIKIIQRTKNFVPAKYKAENEIK